MTISSAEPCTILTASPPAKLRVANLDVLRVLALVMVVLYHVPVTHIATWPTWLWPLNKGWMGCDLFFVLSGWLVGSGLWSSTAKTGTVDVWAFWKRRWLRILPPYFAALIPVAIGEYLTGSSHILFDWRYLLLLQNLWGTNPLFGPAWFLCVQEQVYLLLPLLVLMFASRPRVWGWVLPLFCIVPLILRLALRAPYTELNYRATYFHCEGVFVGIGLAYLNRFQPAVAEIIKKASLPVLPLAIALLLWPNSDEYLFRYSFTVSALCFGIALMATLRVRELGIGRSWIIKTLAAGSYSMYLVHVPAMHAYARILEPRIARAPAAVHVCAALLLVVVVSVVFYLLIEWPIDRLRSRPAQKTAALVRGN